MSNQYLSTVTRKKSTRANLDDYLTYSPRSKNRSFYTRYHIAEGRENLEKFIDVRTIKKIEDQSTDHKEEIRRALAEQRQDNYMQIEDHFRSGFNIR